MMLYHEDNQYSDSKKVEGYANLITDQNLFVIQESEKCIQYFQKGLQSLTKALPAYTSKISKWLIDLILGFVCTVFGAITAVHFKRRLQRTVKEWLHLPILVKFKKTTWNI
jgi:capsular polysaccharide biosynthesis protein